MSRVRPFTEYLTAVEEFLRDPDAAQGLPVWPGTAGFWGIRTGEVTAIAGYNGSGKSTLAAQIMLRLASAREGSKGIIYSPEMPVVPLTLQLVRQATASASTEARAMEKALGWLSYRIRHVHSEGMSTRELCEVIAEQVQKNDIRWVLVDSLMTMTDIRGDDYETQKAFMREMVAMARHYELHVFIVCHMRKPSGMTREKITRYDIRGAGEISDFADNVLLLHRYRDEESGRQWQVLRRDKERFDPGRTVDEVPLNFDQACRQLTPVQGLGSQPYL